jgi:hypothetical protein
MRSLLFLPMPGTKVIKDKLGTCPTHHDISILVFTMEGFDE